MRKIATCIKTKQFDTDVKRLKKKHPSVETDVLFATRLLEAGEKLAQESPYPGFGQHTIIKARVINTASNKGKSSGYRVVYQKTQRTKNGEPIIILIILYTKNEYNSESAIKNEIKHRLTDPNFPKI